jgi:hypothetical protein
VYGKQIKLCLVTIPDGVISREWGREYLYLMLCQLWGAVFEAREVPFLLQAMMDRGPGDGEP